MPSLDETVDLLHLLGDPTRVRLLSVLAREELTVAELTTVLQVPQSRVSTHLGKLREASLLRDRRAGTSTFYALSDAMPAGARTFWSAIAAGIDDAVLEGDRTRCQAAIAARDARTGWPDAFAGEMERHYSPGRTWEATAHAFASLLSLGHVLDLGAGDGAIAQLIAPQARTYTCVDRSPKLVAAAEARLRGLPQTVCEVADATALPFEDDAFDTVLLFHVLTCVADPKALLSEAARVLREGGRMLVATLDAHDHAEVAAAWNHVHPGFRPATLARLLEAEGLVVRRCEVTSRERRAPHFSVVTAVAQRPDTRPPFRNPKP